MEMFAREYLKLPRGMLNDLAEWQMERSNYWRYNKALETFCKRDDANDINKLAELLRKAVKRGLMNGDVVKKLDNCKKRSGKLFSLSYIVSSTISGNCHAYVSYNRTVKLRVHYIFVEIHKIYTIIQWLYTYYIIDIYTYLMSCAENGQHPLSISCSAYVFIKGYYEQAIIQYFCYESLL